MQEPARHIRTVGTLSSHMWDRFAIPRLALAAGAILLLLSFLDWKSATGAGLLGGTVLSVNLESRELVLQMPEGHTSLFSAADARVLQDVKIGDRVSLELDREGRIVKVVKLQLDPGN